MDDDNKYQMLLGPRVGRSTQSTEQYAYVYKEKLFTALDSFSYNDVNDDFDREPYIAHFELKNTQGKSHTIEKRGKFNNLNLSSHPRYSFCINWSPYTSLSSF